MARFWGGFRGRVGPQTVGQRHPRPDDHDGSPEQPSAPVRKPLDQARQQAVPPYVVFHDRTLLELASRRPASLAELAEVGGIGAAKLERYGTALLAVLADN